MNFTTVIGLEVHVQLATRTKLFSPAPVDSLGEPNTRVHAVDLGLPGVLPRLNQRAIELAVRAALALDGAVQPVSVFARKNYFYPDLPKGYQISQFERPYCVGGRVPIGDGRHCRLERIHLEEDAGKLVHTDAGTLVDLNRAGVPLIEIVSEPDLRAAEDAAAFLTNLREILRFAGVSDCDMELGSMRCDANISLMPVGATEYGTKVELKNLNSIKMVQRALEYEQRRQTAILAAGGAVAAETRGWLDERGESRPQRSKETAPDYRYFPDPDLPPLVLAESTIAAVRGELGELPAARRARFAAQYGLPEYDIGVLTQDRRLGDWFEAVVAAGAEPKAASNWIMTDVLGALREFRIELDELRIAPTGLAALLALLAQKALTAVAAKKVFAHMHQHGSDAAASMRALGLERIAEPETLQPLVEAAIAALPKAADDVRNGVEKPLDALKGHVMRATKGRADPAIVDRLLRDTIARS
ncbi:MAG: Asp-tRNA(Asn)/Glu-tRNA(Gln) amidotransferase subunit GatB [Planctomycetes bacterium]|nr:Asp-tRNA(Asn)/Glu-tRNA(Gln) amidotransferase subunit GatB [Planctomycetota bacterium]